MMLTAIGGPRDRKSLSAGAGDRYAVIPEDPGPIPFSLPASLPKLVSTLRKETYRRETFKYMRADGEVSEWKFWVHESLSNDEAFARVMGGYGR